MAKRKRKKRKAIRLKMRTDTTYSIVAVILILLGILVVVSFSGQGELLSWFNHLLSAKLGLSMLFLPFVFISAGLVMLRSKHAWSKPTILLGTILLMLGVMGLSRSGEIGSNIFSNFAGLITSTGTYFFFAALAISGFLIMSQSSLAELIDLIAKPFAKNKDDKND